MLWLADNAWVILVGIVPVNWLLQYWSSKKQATLPAFRSHWTCYWGDWLFVVTNAVFFFSAPTFHILTIVTIFLAALIINIYTHRQWGRANTQGHMFFPSTGTLSLAGWSHLLFSSAEMTIVALSLLLPTNIFLHSLLLLFAVFILIGSKNIHGRVQKMDAYASILLIIALILNLLFFYTR